MKKVLFTIFLFVSFSAFAQNVSEEGKEKEIKQILDNVKTLEEKNAKLNSEVRALKSTLSDFVKTIDSLKNQTKANRDAINQTAKELGIKITTSEETTNQKITEVDNSLSKTTLQAIIGVLFAIIVSGVAYGLLSRKQKSDKTDMIEQLNKTKLAIEESLVKEFGKQTELMDKQLEHIKQQKENTSDVANTQLDHSLALKVADEITLIERNISLMDSGTRGLKQLNRSVEKIKDNLAANGYEIPPLLGKPFNQGMKIIPVSTVPDANLESGMEIISKIIRPQVNYDGKMIQAAQIEISVGY